MLEAHCRWRVVASVFALALALCSCDDLASPDPSAMRVEVTISETSVKISVPEHCTPSNSMPVIGAGSIACHRVAFDEFPDCSSSCVDYIEVVQQDRPAREFEGSRGIVSIDASRSFTVRVHGCFGRVTQQRIAPLTLPNVLLTDLVHTESGLELSWEGDATEASAMLTLSHGDAGSTVCTTANDGVGTILSHNFRARPFGGPDATVTLFDAKDYIVGPVTFSATRAERDTTAFLDTAPLGGDRWSIGADNPDAWDGPASWGTNASLGLESIDVDPTRPDTSLHIAGRNIELVLDPTGDQIRLNARVNPDTSSQWYTGVVPHVTPMQGLSLRPLVYEHVTLFYPSLTLTAENSGVTHTADLTVNLVLGVISRPAP